MKNIITIQHTQSVQHVNGMIGSWCDWELTELGIKQAECIAKRLSREINNKEYIMYSSDLLRAKQTAQIIASSMEIKPKYIDTLREFNLGEAIGKSKQWASNNTKCRVWSSTIDWATCSDEKPFIGAESRSDVWNRVSAFYNMIMEGDKQNIIIVSHDGILSLFYAMWLGFDIDMLDKYKLSGKAGGVSFLHEDSDGNHIISCLNDLSYISI